MTILANDVRGSALGSRSPGAASVASSPLGVEEPTRHIGDNSTQADCRIGARRAVVGKYSWVVTAIASVFTLARFSEAFLVLSANQAGLTLA